MTKNATLPTIDAADLAYSDGDSRLVLQSPFRCGSDYNKTPAYTGSLFVQANEYQVECIVRYSPDEAPELARRLRAAADKISPAPVPEPVEVKP